jgi:hypothetical protein
MINVLWLKEVGGYNSPGARDELIALPHQTTRYFAPSAPV